MRGVVLLTGLAVVVLVLSNCGGGGGGGGGVVGPAPYYLTVYSDYGIANPAGSHDGTTHTYNFVQSVTASVDSPVCDATTPGIRYVCTGWTGTGSVPPSGGDTSVGFTISQDSSITWNWRAEYRLTTTVSPLGAGTVARNTNAQWYQPDEVQLTATPQGGSTFSGWTGSAVTNPDEPNTPETVTITMDGPKSVVANFTGTGSTLAFTVASAYGTPDPPVGPHNCVEGAEVTASVEDVFDTGTGTRYICTGRSGTGSCAPGTETSVTFIIAIDSTITWNWKTQYRLITNASPEGGGTVTVGGNPPAAWYDEGTSVELEANPNPNFDFINWTGHLSTGNEHETLTMDGFKRVTANFAGTGTFHTLTVNSLYGSPDPRVGDHPVPPGTEVTVSVVSPVEVAGTRYTCTGWTAGSGDIPPTGTATSYTIGAPGISQDSSITWEWRLNHLLTVNIVPSRSGTVTRDPNQTWYDPGEIVSLSATAASGYLFASWTGDPVTNPDAPSTPETVVITMNGAKTVNANFSTPGARMWVQRAPIGGTVTRPSARYGHAMVYDSVRQAAILFGGNATYVYQNDTWEWNGAQWDFKNIGGSMPSARYGHSLAYDSARGKVILFGGYDGSSRLNDTWEYDPTSLTWIQVLPTGSPPPRYYAAMAYDSARNEVVLFGGNESDELSRTAETWVYKFYNETDRRWVRKYPSSNPSPRNAAAMAFDLSRNVIVLHGGQVGSSSGFGASSNETWEWNGSNWTAKSASGPSISWHAMAYDAFHLATVLFGGWQGGYNGSRKNETWEWNGSTWTRKSPARNPAARDMHAMVYDVARSGCVMFGGSGATIDFSDTWIWDGVNWRDPISNPLPTSGCTLTHDSNRRVGVLFGGEVATTPPALTDATWEWYDGGWVQATPSSSPSARKYHAAAFDSAHLVTVIFGGCDYYETPKNDTWTWNGSVWTQSTAIAPPARHSHAMAYDSSRNVAVMFGGLAGTTLLNDTWEWDGFHWNPKSPSTKPSARCWHSMAYDSHRAKVVLFGGNSGVDLGDTWEWNGTNWEPISITGPTPRCWHAMTYDSSRRVIVLFGGADATAYYRGDTWEYNGECSPPTWMEIDTATAHPTGRNSHAMCYDAYRTMTVLFGGLDPDYKDDTWEY